MKDAPANPPPAQLLPVVQSAAETYAAFQQARGRLPDLIEGAISIYDNFMRDDDYDTQRCLDRVVAKLKEGRDFYDAQPEPAPSPERGELASLVEACQPFVAALQGAIDSFGAAEAALGGPLTDEDAVTVSIGELRSLKAALHALSASPEGEKK